MCLNFSPSLTGMNLVLEWELDRHPLFCRYMSPTDALVSPVTRGLLARNRRPMRIVNPWGPPKVQFLVSENSDVLLSQMEGCNNVLETRVVCASSSISTAS